MNQPHTNESLIKSASTPRLYYMDNLRALAMLLGVFFHAALAYGPLLQNMWLTSTPDHSVLFDVFSFFSHLFRMPLFFLISGFFAVMLIEKKGIKGFIKHRSLRILLPLLIFFPLLALALLASIDWALTHVKSPSPFLSFIKILQDLPQTEQPFSTMHLWFLYYLFLFVLIIAVLYKFRFFSLSIFSKISSVPWLMTVFPVLLIPALLSIEAPHPAPDKWYPQLWSFGFYGLFFLLGGVIFINQALLQHIQKYKHLLLLVSALLYAYFYSTLPETFTPEMLMMMLGGFNFTWQHVPVAIAEAYISVYMSLYCLIIGQQLLNKRNKVLQLISESSYWIYLIHFPVLMLIQFYLLDVNLSIWFKFIISSFITLIIGLISYLLLVRLTPIGWLLNGKKKKPHVTI